MADFLSDDWFAEVLAAAAPLPEVDGVTFSFEAEVTESAAGKVRAHGMVEAGRLVALQPGKDPVGGADVSFSAKAKRLLPIIRGDVPPLVAYMLGELKIDGAYELVVDRLANTADRDALEAFRAAVAAVTG
jgi:hypothetical protein